MTDEIRELEIEAKFDKLKCQDKIKWKKIPNKEEKQIFFVLAISDEVIDDQAE